MDGCESTTDSVGPTSPDTPQSILPAGMTPRAAAPPPLSATRLGRRSFLGGAVAGAFGLIAYGRRASLRGEGENPRPVPQATLMLVGGGIPEVLAADLQKPGRRKDPAYCDPCGLFREMLRLSSNPRPHVECITCADEDDPNVLGEQHRLVIESLGAGSVGFFGPLQKRDVVRDEAIVERLWRADIVLLCGGDQSLLDERFGATPACAVLRDRYWRDTSFVLAGNSAGAMVLANEMITGGGEVAGRTPSMGTGWNFVTATVDTHVGPRRRRRLGRAVMKSSSGIGVGITTQAALVIGPRTASVVSGPVIFVRRAERAADGRPTRPDAKLLTVEGCEAYARDGLTARIYQPGQTPDRDDLNRLIGTPKKA